MGSFCNRFIERSPSIEIRSNKRVFFDKQSGFGSLIIGTKLWHQLIWFTSRPFVKCSQCCQEPYVRFCTQVVLTPLLGILRVYLFCINEHHIAWFFTTRLIKNTRVPDWFELKCPVCFTTDYQQHLTSWFSILLIYLLFGAWFGKSPKLRLQRSSELISFVLLCILYFYGDIYDVLSSFRAVGNSKISLHVKIYL